MDAKQRRTTLGVLGGFGLLVLVIAAGQCSTTPSGDGNLAQAPGAPETNAADMGLDLAVSGDPPAASPAVQAPQPQWSYSRTRDEVRNGEVVTARIRSTNSTNLDFPYGNVHLNITVRRHPEWGLDVIFAVDEGQILCRIRDCSGTINFDGDPERLSLNESADNDSSVVFAQYPDAVLRKLRDSRRVIVELPFFRNGNRQFTFETTGLQWPPPE